MNNIVYEERVKSMNLLCALQLATIAELRAMLGRCQHDDEVKAIIAEQIRLKEER